MSMYWGEFVSRDGRVWRVEIEHPGSQGGELTFAGAECCVLEWADTTKRDVLQGCALTLRVESPGDRTFTHLYTVETGAVWVRLYRDGAEYWRGQIDPEQYEEPYAYGGRYDVDLTFSDLAILDRLDWTLGGRLTVEEVLRECLERAGLGDVPVRYCLGMYRNQRLEGGALVNGDVMGLSDLRVDTANFFDEDGEAMKLKEVLEAVLTPLSIRLRQKGGEVLVYTLQGLYEGSEAEDIVWDSDDQVLSVDAVYNKVTLTASRYVSDSVLDGSLGDFEGIEEKGHATTYKTQNVTNDDTLDGFTTYALSAAEAEAEFGDDLKDCELGERAFVMKTRSVYSGSDGMCLLWARKGNDTTTIKPNNYDGWLAGLYGNDRIYGNAVGVGDTNQYANVKLVTVKGGYVNGAVSSLIPDTPYYAYWARTLRVSVEMLFDPRYNPYESEGKHNEEDHWKVFQRNVNFAYVACDLVIRDAAGNVVAWYDNKSVLDEQWGKDEGDNTYNIKGQWRTDGLQRGRYRLCWYDWEDRKDKSGLNGWSANKRAIGNYKKALPKGWQTVGTGDFIQLPHVSGYVELTIYPDVYVAPDMAYPYGSPNSKQEAWGDARWLAFRDPKVQIVKANGKEPDDEDTGDVVISAWLNRDAADDLDIDTQYYTAEDAFVGRAAILDADGNPQGEYYRGGHNTTAEHHLIGMVFSQHATPHAVLSGTCKPFDCELLTDAAMDGVFIATGEVYDAQADETQVTAIELTPETYEGIEYE